MEIGTPVASKSQGYLHTLHLSSSVSSLMSINQHPSIHSSQHQIKSTINDSILIEDKENCYISNRPSNLATQRMDENKCHNHGKEKAEYYVRSEGGEEF